ncbi:(2Fe-2S)-binding protein [Paenibacillus sp. S150]|uniref:(2Fe-2S)-binding protein n=1 Tax=Paenibacillus sp. S150 TaxID=2749826 RepID=UPI001C56C3B5|nr:(2Fe-2S)-binding protein [Paenibacillus sp. S150]MBW4080519.1 (2Fe-2S)-binding protein [Paenibacillus sp. S150]
MNEALTQELISKFDLHPAPPAEALHSFKATELVQEEGARTFIACYRPLMKALDDKAAGAYFGSYFSSVALAVQYSISVYSSVPAISLSNLTVHLIPADGYCRIAFSLQDWNIQAAPAEESRESWRNEILAGFYSDTAAPLLCSMSEASGLSLGEIWGQLPTKFNYYIELFTAGLQNSKLLYTLQEDYSYLKDGLPAEVFGLKRNPFLVKVRRIEALADPEQTVQIRNRCCMYYRTEGGSYCYTCPRLKEEERVIRRVEFRKKAASAQG